jgi:hypothetical protein
MERPASDHRGRGREQDFADPEGQIQDHECRVPSAMSVSITTTDRTTSCGTGATDAFSVLEVSRRHAWST